MAYKKKELDPLKLGCGQSIWFDCHFLRADLKAKLTICQEKLSSLSIQCVVLIEHYS